MTSLRGEDNDAWKHYLQEENIEMALRSCRTSAQKAEANALVAQRFTSQG